MGQMKLNTNVEDDAKEDPAGQQQQERVTVCCSHVRTCPGCTLAEFISLLAIFIS